MTLATAPAPATSDTGSDTCHVFCCDPDIALCGEDVSDVPEVPAGVGDDCIVCLDLETQPCPRCGFQPDTDVC